MWLDFVLGNPPLDRKLARILGYLALEVFVLAALILVAAVVRSHWQYPDQITVSATALVAPCQTGCEWFRITDVDDARYGFARGWLIDATQGRSFAASTTSYKYLNSVMRAGRQNGHKSYCLTGKLHRYRQRALLFWPRGDLHEFTVASIRWGNCPGQQPG